MICYFIDYKTYQKKEEELAKLGLFHKNANFLDRKLGISLITCHRIEYYINFQTQISHFNISLKDFNKISDSSEIYHRLFKICIGLNSKIIGENSIFKQISKSTNDYLYYNPQDKACMNILINAKKIRDKFKFYARNHGQLIYDYIKNDQSKTILFFGAGLLNQTIINSIDCLNDYKNIILVTRNTQKAKKYITNIKFPLYIIEISKINKKILSQFYNIFVATDQINSVYKKEIINLCMNRKCLNIVDISSSPIVGLKNITNKYFSLYSKNTDKLVENSNIKIRQKQIKLKKYLKNKKNDWYIN